MLLHAQTYTNDDTRTMQTRTQICSTYSITWNVASKVQSLFIQTRPLNRIGQVDHTVAVVDSTTAESLELFWSSVLSMASWSALGKSLISQHFIGSVVAFRNSNLDACDE